MQQFFTVTNAWLQLDAKCQQRHLHVRTYVVVPLSHNSGVLEWCEGSIPIMEYLTKKANKLKGLLSCSEPCLYPRDTLRKMCPFTVIIAHFSVYSMGDYQ